MHCHYNLSSLHNCIFAILQNIYHAFWSIIFWKAVVTYISRFTDIVIYSLIFFFRFSNQGMIKKKFKFWWSPFSPISTKWTITPLLKSLNIVTTTTYAVTNVSRSLRQEHTCGGVQPVNMIQTQSNDCFLTNN